MRMGSESESLENAASLAKQVEIALETANSFHRNARRAERGVYFGGTLAFLQAAVDGESQRFARSGGGLLLHLLDCLGARGAERRYLIEQHGGGSQLKLLLERAAHFDCFLDRHFFQSGRG